MSTVNCDEQEYYDETSLDQKPENLEEYNDLAKAEEPEEDFDAFNSETFADDGAPLTDDWEAEHDKLLMLEKDYADDDDQKELNQKEHDDNEGFSNFNDQQSFLNNKLNLLKSNLSAPTNGSNYNNKINDTIRNNSSLMDNEELAKLQLLQQQQLLQNKQLNEQQLKMLLLQQQHQQQNQQLGQNKSSQPALNEQQLKLLQLQQQIQFQQHQNNQNQYKQQLLLQQLQLQQMQQQQMNMLKNGHGQINDNKRGVNNLENLLANLSLPNSNKLNQNGQQGFPFHENGMKGTLQNDRINNIENSFGPKQAFNTQAPLTNAQSSPAFVNPLLGMLNQHQLPPPPSLPPPINKLAPLKDLGNVKTVEELEKEMLNQESSSKTSDSTKGILTDISENDLKLNNQMNQMQQTFLQQQQLELMKLINLMNTNMNMSSNENLLLQQKQLLQAFALQQQHNFIQQQQTSRINNNVNPNMMLPPNFQYLTPQQKQMILAQRNMMFQQQMMQQQPPPNMTRMHADQIDQMGPLLRNQNDMMDQTQSPKYKNINNNNNRHQNHYQHQQQNHANRNIKNGDVLAGMMTDKEKNWVINVQMLQLQNDDPYSYDFYYTAWMSKKKQFSSSNSTLKTSVLFQSTNKHDPKSYRQLTFENSLGKVTVSNFNHPRALIDINQKPHEQQNSCTSVLISHINGLDDDDDEKQKDAKNINTILLEIEKMYQVYLLIDDIEHKILKEPEETRTTLFHERRSKVDKLASMICSENFPHYLFVAKGKRLLGKCIHILNSSQTKLILGYFMQYLYIIAKNDISMNEIYTQISYSIDTQKFIELVSIVNPFVQLYSKQSNQLYQAIFSNKFCLSFLLKFVSKSELVIEDDYESDVKTVWDSFINLILTGLSALSENNNLQSNLYEVCTLNRRTLFENFNINTELWSRNQNKLNQLFNFVNE